MGIFDFLKKNKKEQTDENLLNQGMNPEIKQAESDTQSPEESISDVQVENLTQGFPVNDEQTEVFTTANEEQEESVSESLNEGQEEPKEETALTPVNEEQEEPQEQSVSEPLNDEQTELSEEETEDTAPVEDFAPIFIDEESEAEEQEQKKEGFFSKIKNGLKKTRENIMSGVENVLKSFTTIDEELYEELEEALIMADIGVETSVEIIERLRERVKSEKVHDVSEVRGLIVSIISDMLKEDKSELNLAKPSVILVIGVNGVGKTTTIGKLANHYKNQGRSVILAAADTFRAAAIDQLEVWGERNNVPVVKHQENSDPAAVVFDAVQSAKAKNVDLLICDTAGRLHNKKNLMDELAKIFKVIGREYPEAQQEVFLVLDATTGQNALQQARLFKEAAGITGLVLTKLDGTAKGGVIIAIKNELKLPVRFVGVGEGIDDLQPFDEEEFARALFEE